MGAFLDKPKTEKYNEASEGAGLRYGLSSMQVGEGSICGCRGWPISKAEYKQGRRGPGGDKGLLVALPLG